MLLGRARECERLRGMLDGAEAGQSGVLLIEGDPGIGKTTLLDYARSYSAAATTLSVRGIENEPDIPYLGLADLLRGRLSHLDQIPGPQHAALAGVLTVGPATAGDRFAVAAATLSLFGALGGDGSVLVIVDDAQWLDTESLEVVAFVARRLDAEGVAMLVAARPHESIAVLSGVEKLDLEGLDRSSAEQLVETHAAPGLGRDLRRRLVTETRANPLALIELSSSADLDHLALWARQVTPLPVSSAIEEGFGRRLRQMPAATQEALLLLSVLGSVSAAVYTDALARRGLDLDALGPAESSGLVVVDGIQVGFTHPLVRAAAHGIATPPERRAAHAVAAAVLAGASVPNAMERRAWHQVAAGITPDHEFAGMLEAAAEQEFSKGNWSVAGHLFQRAAELADRPDRTRLLVRASDGARLSGGIDEASLLLGRALGGDLDDALRTAIRYYRLRIDMWRRAPRPCRDELVALADQVSDPGLAALMLTDAAVATADLDEPVLAAALTERAIALCPGPVPLPVRVVRALMLALSGRSQAGHDLIDGTEAEVDALDALAGELVDQLLLVIGVCHFALEETARSRKLIERAVAAGRDASAVGVLPFRIGRLAWVDHWRGNWNAALAHTHESIRLAQDTGWVHQVPAGLVMLARIEAGQGKDDDCRRHAAAARELAVAGGMRTYAVLSEAALGLLDLGHGDTGAALDHLAVVTDFAEGAGLVDTPLLSWTGDLVEALVRAGRPADAARALERVAERSRGELGPTAMAVAARCRSLLEPGRFEHHLRSALVLHQRSEMPFETARTQLVLGEQLRRHRRRGEARTVLQKALATFERLGATGWAARARTELQAAGYGVDGEPGDGRSAVASTLLTPQELQVAMAVADGYSNREVAVRLFLSVKTIEFHLSNVYRKLGLSSRSQLTRLLARQARASR